MDTDKVLAIYPSLQKYQESRRIPFVVLADRFRRSLALPETLCLVTGYSFGDEHINELIYDAARLHRGSEVLVLCHSRIPQDLLDRAQSTPNLTVLGPTEAVIGCNRGEWTDHDEDSTFWEESQFVLGDFKNLSAFLLGNTKVTPDQQPDENT